MHARLVLAYVRGAIVRPIVICKTSHEKSQDQTCRLADVNTDRRIDVHPYSATRLHTGAPRRTSREIRHTISSCACMSTLAQIQPPLTMTTVIIVNMYAHVNQNQNDTTKLQMAHKNYEYENATSESGTPKRGVALIANFGQRAEKKKEIK